MIELQRGRLENGKKWPRSRSQIISHALVYAGFACFLCGFLCFAIHMFMAESDLVFAGQPISPLGSVKANDDHLYLLYSNVPMVKVYDLAGNFQYDMRALPIPNDNGGKLTMMIADGHDLYLITRTKDVYLWTKDVYLWTKDVYVQSWKDESGNIKWNELGEKYQYYNVKQRRRERDQYEIRSEDVWHVHEDGTAEKVVNRPWIFKILNPTVLLLSPWPFS